MWLLRTPRPEPAAELAGTRTMVATTRVLSGRHRWESTGTSTARLQPVIDPDIIRRLDVGQAAYIYRGGVTYLHVKPPAGPVTRAPLAGPDLPDEACKRGPAPVLRLPSSSPLRLAPPSPGPVLRPRAVGESTAAECIAAEGTSLPPPAPVIPEAITADIPTAFAEAFGPPRTAMQST
jgi:hypothetical protein